MKFKYIISILLTAIVLLTMSGCAGQGLLIDKYPPEFYTVPKLLTNDTENFNPAFIVYGDTQGSWSLTHKFMNTNYWWTPKALIFPFYEIYMLGQGAVGTFNYIRRTPDIDPALRLFIRQSVYRDFKKNDGDFILNTGDICANDGRRPQNWAVFLRENMHDYPLLREIPYLPTVGNHDRVNDKKYGYPNYKAVFGYEPFYRIDFKDVTLLVIDSNIINDWKNELDDNVQNELFRKFFVSGDEENPAWLEKQLADSDKKFKIISMHHSPFSYAHHWQDWLRDSDSVDAEDMRKKIVEIMQKYGVNAVFSGHDHIYQHNILHLQDYPGGGIHFIVSSSGGVPLRDKNSAENIDNIRRYYQNQGFDVEPLLQEKKLHYTLVDIDSEDLKIQAYELFPDGSEKVFDELTIKRD